MDGLVFSLSFVVFDCSRFTKRIESLPIIVVQHEIAPVMAALAGATMHNYEMARIPIA